MSKLIFARQQHAICCIVFRQRSKTNKQTNLPNSKHWFAKMSDNDHIFCVIAFESIQIQVYLVNWKTTTNKQKHNKNKHMKTSWNHKNRKKKEEPNDNNIANNMKQPRTKDVVFADDECAAIWRIDNAASDVLELTQTDRTRILTHLSQCQPLLN